MEAKLYQTKISESDLHYVHGMFRTIWEVYIVEPQIIINSASGIFVCKDGPRSPIGEVFNIEFPYDISEKIFSFINKKKEIEDLLIKVFTNIEELKNLTAADGID
jgi:hypothetical protein